MITLVQANSIIETIIKRGAELQCRPLSVVVVELGCVVKAFQKEDGSSMVRFEMAFGKAYASLALGRSSKLVRIRNEEKPAFMKYLFDATDNKKTFEVFNFYGSWIPGVSSGGCGNDGHSKI